MCAILLICSSFSSSYGLFDLFGAVNVKKDYLAMDLMILLFDFFLFFCDEEGSN